jgi:hypothetical protein
MNDPCAFWTIVHNNLSCADTPLCADASMCSVYREYFQISGFVGIWNFFRI